MVPGGGVEPPRPEGRRILSPLRLPVPPSRLWTGPSIVRQSIYGSAPGCEKCTLRGFSLALAAFLPPVFGRGLRRGAQTPATKSSKSGPRAFFVTLQALPGSSAYLGATDFGTGDNILRLNE
jgi:hypothetical protein